MAEDPIKTPLPPSDAPKPALRLKSQKFREVRQGDWRLLSSQLDKAERNGLKAFSLDELLNLPVLYRSAMSSLSMAQSISLDRNMIIFLQSLCLRAYIYIYGPQTRLKDILQGFFGRSWPQAVRKLAGEICLAILVMMAGIAIGWLLCSYDASWYNILMPSGQAQGRDLDASEAYLRSSVGGAEEGDQLSPFAVMLMTHNTTVAISTFALGVVFGLPTFALLLQFFAGLGAMIWLFARKGLGVEFVGWLSIHGTTELFAILIAAGCGFHLARQLMFPGNSSRLASLAAAGRLTGTVMIGVAIMMTVAGCIEGIARQMITETWLRYAIGGVMLTLWLLYYGLAGRERRTPPAPDPKSEVA